MQDLLEERKKVDPKILAKVECSNHLAANVQGRKSDMYDVQGIAATVCRHEQVRKLCRIQSLLFFLQPKHSIPRAVGWLLLMMHSPKARFEGLGFLAALFHPG